MLTEADARQKIAAFLAEHGHHLEGGLVLLEDLTQSKPYGWVFFDNSHRYVETRNMRDWARSLPSPQARRRGRFPRRILRTLGEPTSLPAAVELKSIPLDVRGRPKESTFVYAFPLADAEIGGSFASGSTKPLASCSMRARA